MEMEISKLIIAILVYVILHKSLGTDYAKILKPYYALPKHDASYNNTLGNEFLILRWLE